MPTSNQLVNQTYFKCVFIIERPRKQENKMSFISGYTVSYVGFGFFCHCQIATRLPFTDFFLSVHVEDSNKAYLCVSQKALATRGTNDISSCLLLNTLNLD